MGVGVVVAGLAIGALVAILMQRSGERPPLAQAPAVVVTSTPGLVPATRPPLAIATLEPTRTERPSPTPTATPERTAAPPSPSPRPTVERTTQRAQSQSPTAQPARIARETERASTPPAVISSPSLRPTSTPAATSTPTSPPAAPSSPPTESHSVYDEHAAAVVRRYVDALIRGDQPTAYAALGGSGTLSEQSFLDPTARIVSLKVTRIDASNASVGCEIATAKGSYYVTFHVTAATSGPYISQHDFIKV
jgi:hypothetical protein